MSKEKKPASQPKRAQQARKPLLTERERLGKSIDRSGPLTVSENRPRPRPSEQDKEGEA